MRIISFCSHRGQRILPSKAGEEEHAKRGRGGHRLLLRISQIGQTARHRASRVGRPLHHPSDGPPPPLRGGGCAHHRLARLGLFAALTLAASAVAAQDADSLNPLKALGRGSLDTFVQKPLFDPARRLPPPPPPLVVDTGPPPPPPAEPPPALQLIGVVRGQRGDMAIVHRDGNEKTVVLRSGDKLGNWTVAVSPPNGVSLSDGDRKVDFAIFAKSGAGMPPPPPQAVTVGQGPRRPPDE